MYLLIFYAIKKDIYSQTTLSFDASEQDERVEVLRSKKETIKPGDKSVVAVRLLEIDPNVKVGTAFKITFTGFHSILILYMNYK